MNKLAQGTLNPLRIDVDPEVGIEARELWCPCDAKKVPPVIGNYLCPCGWIITISPQDVEWIEENNGRLAESG